MTETIEEAREFVAETPAEEVPVDPTMQGLIRALSSCANALRVLETIVPEDRQLLQARMVAQGVKLLIDTWITTTDLLEEGDPDAPKN